MDNYVTVEQHSLASPKSRKWVFTWNNPTTFPDWEEFDGLVYGVYQRERGSEGTEHFQGFLYFRNAIRRTTLARLLPSAYIKPGLPHVKPEDAAAYCKKEDTRVDGPYEFGKLPQQGKRTDVTAFRDAVFSGATDAELVNDDGLVSTWVRFQNLASRLRNSKCAPRRLSDAPSVTLCIGKPRTGKSSWVFKNYPTCYEKPSAKWWTRYSGEPLVVLDDFNGSHCSFTDLKLMLDRNRFVCDIKNGDFELQADTFIITTNHHPKYWYAEDVYGRYGYDAIWKRFTRVLVFSGNFVDTGMWTIDEIPRSEFENWFTSEEIQESWK